MALDTATAKNAAVDGLKAKITHIAVFSAAAAGAAVVTSGVEISVDRYTDPGNDPRPAAWQPAIVVDGKTAFIVRDLAPGRYAVWARFTAGTEQPVRLVGGFRVT